MPSSLPTSMRERARRGGLGPSPPGSMAGGAASAGGPGEVGRDGLRRRPVAWRPWSCGAPPAGSVRGEGHGRAPLRRGLLPACLGPFASEPACCPSPSARAGGVRGPRARRPRLLVQSFSTALEMERRGPLSNLARVLQYPLQQNILQMHTAVRVQIRLQSPVRAALKTKGGISAEKVGGLPV